MTIERLRIPNYATERLEIPWSRINEEASLSCRSLCTKEKKIPIVSSREERTFSYLVDSSLKREEKRRNKELKGVRNGVAARNTRTRKWFTGDIFAGFVFYLAFLGQPQVQKGSRDLAWFRE